MSDTPTSPIDRTAPWWLSAAIFCYAALFSGLGALKYLHFGYNALDLAIINQVYFQTLAGHPLASTIHPPTYLNDHFTPIIFALVPLYAIGRHPLTLVILQNILLALTAYPLFFLARKFLNSKKSMLVALAWLLNPMIQNLSLFEFHDLTLALLPLFLALWFFWSGRFWLFAASALVALLVREDVALVIFMFGVLAALEKKSWRWIAAPMLAAAGYFFLALKIIGHFSAQGNYKFLIYYSYLGDNLGQMLATLLLHPSVIAGKLLSLGNLEMILGFLLPLCFVPLLGARYLLLALLVYAQIVLGGQGASGLVIKTQYATLFMPALFMAFIVGLNKYERGAWRKPLGVDLARLNPLILVLALGYAMVTLGPLPGTLYKHVVADDAFAQAAKRALIASIPPDAPVAAGYDLITPLSSRLNAYAFNYFFTGLGQFATVPYHLPENVEYLAVNASDFIAYEIQYRDNPLYQAGYDTGAGRIRDLLKQGNFGITQMFDDIIIWRKNTASDIVLYELSETLAPGLTQIEAALGPDLILAGSDAAYQAHDKSLHGSLAWRLNAPIEKNLFARFIFLDDTGKPIYSKLVPLGAGIFPTSAWPVGQVIQTRHSVYLPMGRAYADARLEIVSLQAGGIYLASDLTAETRLSGEELIGSASLSPYLGP